MIGFRTSQCTRGAFHLSVVWWIPWPLSLFGRRAFVRSLAPSTSRPLMTWQDRQRAAIFPRGAHLGFRVQKIAPTAGAMSAGVTESRANLLHAKADVHVRPPFPTAMTVEVSMRLLRRLILRQREAFPLRSQSQQATAGTRSTTITLRGKTEPGAV